VNRDADLADARSISAASLPLSQRLQFLTDCSAGGESLVALHTHIHRLGFPPAPRPVARRPITAELASSRLVTSAFSPHTAPSYGSAARRCRRPLFLTTAATSAGICFSATPATSIANAQRTRANPLREDGLASLFGAWWCPSQCYGRALSLHPRERHEQSRLTSSCDRPLGRRRPTQGSMTHHCNPFLPTLRACDLRRRVMLAS